MSVDRHDADLAARFRRGCARGTRDFGARLRLDHFARARQRLREALVVERLHQIVDGGDVERLERERVERGGEDRGRHLLGAERPRRLPRRCVPGICTSRNTRSGSSVADRLDRLVAVAAVPTISTFVLVREQILDALPRQRLVIDDHHAQRAVRHARETAARSPRHAAALRVASASSDARSP